MMLLSVVLASFIATASGQATPPPGGCLVCGEGMVVTAPEAIFIFPGQPQVTCDQLQDAGLVGQVPLDQCPLLPPLLTICDCAPGDLPTDPPAPTDPPGAPTPCPDVPADGCSVCGAGLCVTIPDAIFVFPNQPSTPCNILEQAGFDGLVPIESCPFLPDLVEDTCGCMSSIPGGAEPTAPPVDPPTPPPVDPPTPPPVDPPTPPPVDPPTPPPVDPPTPVPVQSPTPMPVNTPPPTNPPPVNPPPVNPPPVQMPVDPQPIPVFTFVPIYTMRPDSGAGGGGKGGGGKGGGGKRGMMGKGGGAKGGGGDDDDDDSGGKGGRSPGKKRARRTTRVNQQQHDFRNDV